METKYTRTDRSKTEIELEITIPEADFTQAYEAQIKELAKNVDIKGFRKGKAPVELIERGSGNQALEKALYDLMPKYALEAIKKEKIEPSGLPVFKVKKFAKGSEAVFVAVIPMIPEFKIPDVKKLDVKLEEVKTEPKDVDALLKHLWQEHKGKSKNMDDAWVKSIAKSNGFKSATLADLKKELAEMVLVQKKNIANQKYSSDLLAAAIAKSGLEVPGLMVQREAYEREASFQEEIKKIGVTEEQFCKLRDVTMEQLRQQWARDSRLALQNDVFLFEYAKVKNVKVEPSELEAEIKTIQAANPKAKPEVFDNEQWVGYIERVLIKRKAFAQFMQEASPQAAK